MKLFTKTALLAAAGIVAMSATAANAAYIPDGTVAEVNFRSPVVITSTNPATVSFSNVTTHENETTGGFADAFDLSGKMNGTLSFSPTMNATLSQLVSNFFVFDDGHNGTFNFSVTSVQTQQYDPTGANKSFTLYLLGTTLDANSNALYAYDPTATSLTLQFNSTGSSSYAVAGSLAVPPDSTVPEPASWAMMVGGFGLLGGALRRKRTTTAVTFG